MLVAVASLFVYSGKRMLEPRLSWAQRQTFGAGKSAELLASSEQILAKPPSQETVPALQQTERNASPAPKLDPPHSKSKQTTPPPSFPLPHDKIRQLRDEYDSGVKSLAKDVLNGRDRTPSYPFISGDGFRHLCRLRCEDQFKNCNFKPEDVKRGDCIYLALFNLSPGGFGPSAEYMEGYQKMSSQISQPHVVITANGDMSTPDGDDWHKNAAGEQFSSMPAPKSFSSLLEQPLLLGWFASNCNWNGDRPKPAKLHCIPLGIENRYNEVGGKPEAYFPWMEGRHTVQPDKLLFVGFRSAVNKPLRDDAITAFRGQSWVTTNEHSVEEPGKLSREDFVRTMQKHHFAACPPGHGFDTHRLYEVLMAGVFPVVISGPMDDVYKGLPVLVVKKWPDVTEKLLRDTLETFQARRDWAMDKLFFPYWRDLISSVSKQTTI